MSATIDAADAQPVGWEFAAVLPNLGLPSLPDPGDTRHWSSGITFPDSWVAITRETDPRVTSLRARSPALNQILSSFRSSYDQPIECAVLIWRTDAPEQWRGNFRPMVAFRNGVAIATVLLGRAQSVNGYGGLTPTFSDVFDLHPAAVGGLGRMVLQSPAYLDVAGPEQKRVLTPSPYVSRQTAPFWHDLYLFNAIARVWRRRYGGRPRWVRYADRLFRSLEVAYQACGVGARNEASIMDYGTQVALWISAIEILAWPERRHANLDSVLALLTHPALGERALRRRFRVKLKANKKGETRMLSQLQRAYLAMYAARNHFLHGNPVGISTLLLKRRKATASLPRLAAIVYRAALVAYLDKVHRKRLLTLKQVGDRFGEMMQDDSYDEALDDLFGGSS